MVRNRTAGPVRAPTVPGGDPIPVDGMRLSDAEIRLLDDRYYPANAERTRAAVLSRVGLPAKALYAHARLIPAATASCSALQPWIASARRSRGPSKRFVTGLHSTSAWKSPGVATW